MSDIGAWENDIHQGDAADTLADLPESSVHMVMTSPPYFGLRDYGVDGQIGLEESLDEYIEELVDVFREVRRALRPDGSAWLNLGDSYDGGKNKMLVPHRVAIALQEDGWIVRNDVTWIKPNPMPSSVKDRLNTTTEQVFHLVPKPDYWYDLDAIREPHAEATHERDKYGSRTNDEWVKGQDDNHNASGHSGMNPAGKNPGDVFEVTTKPFPEAHFAVYPPELVEKPLKATCPPKVCAACGSPYERDVERKGGPQGRHQHATDFKSTEAHNGATDNDNTVTGGSLSQRYREHGYPERIHKGWERTCDCDTDATEAGIALDPFAGAGTTALVAKDHGRRFVGIDLNEEYVAMAQKRLGLTVENPEYVRDNADSGLEEWV